MVFGWANRWPSVLQTMGVLLDSLRIETVTRKEAMKSASLVMMPVDYRLEYPDDGRIRTKPRVLDARPFALAMHRSLPVSQILSATTDILPLCLQAPARASFDLHRTCRDTATHYLVLRAFCYCSSLCNRLLSMIYVQCKMQSTVNFITLELAI